MYKSKALYYRNYLDKLEEAERYCLENNLELTYINGMDEFPVNILPHEQFLELLTCFDYYLDFKGLTSKEVISKSALEALTVGCKVIVDTGDEVVSFSMTKFDEYIKMYLKVLGRG